MLPVIGVIAISLLSVLKFLLLLAVIALLVVGVKYLFGLMGWNIPQPIWVIIGIIVFLVLVIAFFGGGISLS